MGPARNAYGTQVFRRVASSKLAAQSAEPIGQRLQFTGKNACVCDPAMTRKVNSGFVPISPHTFQLPENVMSFDKVSPGKNIPDAFNVVIEIPMNADPIKYEVDKESGAIFVDRFMTTAMYYPANYGYVPQTLSGDGDPVDVLVIAPYPLLPGVVVPCRPLGILMMEDEAGVDGKVLAVPTDKVLPIYSHWKSVDDVNPMRLKAISHFFEHYKDLEAGKWVKVLGWEGIEAAKKEVIDGIAAYKK